MLVLVNVYELLKKCKSSQWKVRRDLSACLCLKIWLFKVFWFFFFCFDSFSFSWYFVLFFLNFLFFVIFAFLNTFFFTEFLVFNYFKVLLAWVLQYRPSFKFTYNETLSLKNETLSKNRWWKIIFFLTN